MHVSVTITNYVIFVAIISLSLNLAKSLATVTVKRISFSKFCDLFL